MSKAVIIELYGVQDLNTTRIPVLVKLLTGIIKPDEIRINDRTHRTQICVKTDCYSGSCNNGDELYSSRGWQTQRVTAPVFNFCGGLALVDSVEDWSELVEADYKDIID